MKKMKDLEELNTLETKGENNNKSTVLSELLSYLKIIVFAVVIAFLLNNFVIVNAQVKSGSMSDGIKTWDRLIGFRFSYISVAPERGDVVLFKFPDDETQTFIKRVIGIPGDTIEIKSGVLYINGEVYQEDYLKEPMIGSFGPYFVPQNSYFMMGDNRNDSKDSRFWVNTYVSKDKILGKAIFKYYTSLEFIK